MDTNQAQKNHLDFDGWVPDRKQDCRACGTECTLVLVSYGDEPQWEWECLSCGKSFNIKKINQKPRKKKYGGYNRKRQNNRSR